MDVTYIPFRNTGYFSDLICDYLDEKESLRPFYHRFPRLEEFKAQIAEKAGNFPPAGREVLHRVLKEQNTGLPLSEKTGANIEAIRESATFTVVTGHQLNIFTGPIYFLYKIITTINLCLELKKSFPDAHFVPVYWMAAEDHDFDEVNHFYFRGKKLKWNREATGAVGRLSTAGLGDVFRLLELELGKGDNAEGLKSLFKKAYLEHGDMASASRFLVNALFGDYGLVILDGDSAELKHLMVPFIRKDLEENISHPEVEGSAKRIGELSEHYKVQVSPREINYFYLTEGMRERIVEREGRYFVMNTDKEHTRESLIAELEAHPERFSPNVVSRPLYQEVVLPNLAYVGGAGELAYWLELKSYFGAMKVVFPILVLRDSVLLISAKQQRKLEKLNVSQADLFLPQSSLINKKIREISNIEIDFTPQKNTLADQFKALYELASQTDASFLGAVRAQETKQKKGLDRLEKRLLKAQRRKLSEHVVRIAAIQNAMFPEKSLQERQLNFAEMYLEMGNLFIPRLINTLKPLKDEFKVIRY